MQNCVIFRNNLNFLVIDSYGRSSFENLVCKIPGPIPLLAVLIYRPPPMQTSFLSDLSELLTEVCALSSTVILLGDLNVHIDKASTMSTDFMSVLDCFGFTQHVNFPTHEHGHTPDLICTTGLDNIAVCGSHIGISDHHFIEFRFNFHFHRCSKQTMVT